MIGLIMLIKLILILIISSILILTGLRKQPGIGIIAAIMILTIYLCVLKIPLTKLGFGFPENWFRTILIGLVLGIIIQLFSVTFLEPLVEKITKSTHDHSVVASAKGSWKVFLQWMIMVWILVAVIEEGLYRGFLMSEIKVILGVGTFALLINLVFSSIVFGLSHGYQGASGMISTGLVGLIIGGIFILSDFNLWLAIFTHGFIDTIGIGLIALGGDDLIRKKLWRRTS